MVDVEMLYKQSSSRHKHLCPRQILGVRMGLLAAKHLDFELPQTKKRLITIIETDGCFVDGIEVATGCTLGHRTLRFEDYGKVAATFVDTETENAFRIAPRSTIRHMAHEYAPNAKNRWEEQQQAIKECQT